MSKDVNIVILVGRLTKDPELKYTVSGKAVTVFSVANNQDYKEQKATYFFEVTVWGNMAINCEKYLKKGSQVVIEGTLTQQTWDDKTTGNKRSKVTITASSVQFIGSVGNKEKTSFQDDNHNPWDD